MTWRRVASRQSLAGLTCRLKFPGAHADARLLRPRASLRLATFAGPCPPRHGRHLAAAGGAGRVGDIAPWRQRHRRGDRHRRRADGGRADRLRDWRRCLRPGLDPRTPARPGRQRARAGPARSRAGARRRPRADAAVRLDAGHRAGLSGGLGRTVAALRQIAVRTTAAAGDRAGSRWLSGLAGDRPPVAERPGQVPRGVAAAARAAGLVRRVPHRRPGAARRRGVPPAGPGRHPGRAGAQPVRKLLSRRAGQGHRRPRRAQRRLPARGGPGRLPGEVGRTDLTELPWL